MGWASGTSVCIDIWKVVRKHIPENKRASVLAKVIDALQDQDWDCVEEIEGIWPESIPALKKVLGSDYQEQYDDE